VTPGISTSVLREVEDLTSYEPPREMPADPRPDRLREYPVAFSYSPGTTGSSITARTVFAGADYSGRPGNYFVHALVTDSAADYGALLPVQLWDAPLWRTEPVPGNDLPALPGPPPQGPLDRASVQRLVRGSARALMPALLTAAGQAIAGERPVLLAGQDSAANAAWIAAVSYLLGDLAWQLSFTTYTSRPAYSRHHLIGVLASGLPADQGFHVCDPASGRAPELTPHPLAALLARTGVVAAEPLWSAAAGLASGQEAGFDDWYPVLAAASVLAGADVEPDDVAAVTTWLRGDRGSSGTRVLAKLLDLAEQPGGPAASLSAAGLSGADLHALGAYVSSETLRRRLDDRAVDDALGHLRRGKPVDASIQLYTTAARQRAAREVVAGLKTLPPEANAWALFLLEWVQAVGASLPADDLKDYGRAYLDPFAGDPSVVARILSAQPAIKAGFVAKLAERPGLARELLEQADRAAAITGVIRVADLGSHEELAELWLLAAVAAGDLAPLDALGEVARRRPLRPSDAVLLDHLWPRRCPPDDLVKLLAQVRGPGLDEWLADQVAAALADQSGSGQQALLRALADRPDLAKKLKPEAQQLAKSLSAISSLVAKAKRGEGRAQLQALGELYKLYQQLDGTARKKVASEVPRILAEVPRLDLALRGCPAPLRSLFCGHISKSLTKFNADPELAAGVFAAQTELNAKGDKADKATATALGKEIEEVLDWKGGQLRAMRKALDDRYVIAFDDWQQANRGGGKVRGLLRGFRKDGD
jgi:hypothetical protein